MSMDGTPNDDDLQGTDQSETINGGAGDDVINGGAGADTYVGGAGNDRYILADPDTIDTLDFRSDDQQQDILDISQLLPDGAEVNADNLKQFLKVNSNGVFVDSSGGNYFTEDSQVARFSANNPALSTTIAVQVASGVIINYAWGDTAEAPLASSPADSVEDSESLNEVTGNASDDELSGTDENDLLSGGYGDDVLNGGAGADVYDGGAGSDRYVLSDTESVDTLHFVSTMHEKDTIDVSQILPAGATVDNISDYIRITEDGIYLDEEGNGEFGDDDLVAKFTEDSIFSGDNLELIIDDTDNTIDFSFSREIGSVLQGSQSYQTESQVTEKLVLRNRDGSELENGNSSEAGFIRSAAGDKIELDLSARNLTTAHGAYGDERLDASGVDDAESIQLFGRAGNDTLQSNDGDSFLDGGAGNDLLIAGGGRNVMIGGEGRDEFRSVLTSSENTRVNWDTIYDFSSQEGHRDILDLSDILPAEATAENINDYVQVTNTGVYVDTSGNGLFSKSNQLVRFGARTDMDHLVDIRIANETVIQLNRNVETTTIQGTGNDDTFEGGEGSQTLRGGAGDDVLYGDSLASTSSADALFGGEGNDRLHVDNLDLTEGTVDGGEGIDSMVVDSAESGNLDVDLASLNIERVYSASGNDVIDASGFDAARGRYDNEGNLIDNEAQGTSIFARAGNDTITGGEGDDYLDGGSGDDVITDGAGRDMLSGGSGDDRFVLSDDNDIDHIFDFTSDNEQQDILDVTALVPAGTTQAEISNYIHVTQSFIYLDSSGGANFNDNNRIARFGKGTSFSDDVRIMVDGTELTVERNDAPEVGDALARATDEDNAIVLSQEDLLGNVTDREDSSLTASNLTTRNASITDDGNGNFTITPNENYNGQINVYYDVSDGALTVSNKLELTVNAVNDAPDDPIASVTDFTFTFGGQDIDDTTQTHKLSGNYRIGNSFWVLQEGDDLVKAVRVEITDNDDGTLNIKALEAKNIETDIWEGLSYSEKLGFFNEDGNEVDLALSASDAGYGIQNISINGAPVGNTFVDDSAGLDVEHSHLSVTENAESDTSVNRVASRDADRDSVTYSLSDDADGRFTIDSSTGVIRVAESGRLDFESDARHTITVSIDDGNGGITTKDYTVNVLDINEGHTLSASGNLTTGLVGEVYDTDSEVSSLSDLDDLIANNSPSATFTATSLDYSSASTIGEFLGSDADSLSVDIDANASDSVGYSLTGYIRIPEGVHNFRVTSGDSFRLTVGEKEVIDHFGTRDAVTSTGYFTASEAGYYRFELVYWEQDDSEGLQVTSSIVGGDVLTSDVLFTSFPSINFTENADATAVTDDLVLSDPELDTPESAVVKITAGYVEEDELIFTDQNGITGSWDADTGTLTLTGTASIADYQAALRSVSYRNDSDNPDTSDRVLSYTVSDGNSTSEPLGRTIEITATNDGPDAPAPATTSDEQRVNTETADDQKQPDLTPLGDGFISVWVSDANGVRAIRAQKYNADMSRDGEEFTINDSTLNDDDYWRYPEVEVLANGNYAISYEHFNPGSWVKAKMQVFDASGNEVRGEFEVGHSYYHTTMVALTDNRFATASVNGGNGQVVTVNIFDDSGNLTTTTHLETGSLSWRFGSPDIVALEDGQFAVTWRSSETTNDSAAFQTFDADGNATSEIINFGDDNPTSERATKLAVMDDGGLLTVYQSGDNIFFQRWNDNGEAQGDPVMINTDESGRKEDVDVTVLGDGSFYVVWSSAGQDGSGTGIYARRFDSDGSALTDEVLVNESTRGNQSDPQIIQTNGGTIQVQWVSSHEGDSNIYQTTLPSDHVYENAGNGTLVMVVNASDLDGDTMSFSLTDDAGGRFAIDEDTGHITVADGSLLNFEDETSHSITVEANDGNGGTSTETFTIGVFNINEAATITGTDTGDVTEDEAATLTASGSLNVTDPDANQSEFTAETVNGTYGILTINADGDWTYEADNTQSAIQSVGDGETVRDRIQVRSVGGTTHTIVITLNGVNDAPTTDNNSLILANGDNYTFSADDFGFSDPDENDSLQSLTITSLPSSGDLTLNGNAVTAGQEINASDIGNLVYEAASGNNDAGSGFGFTVSDGDASSAASTFNISSVSSSADNATTLEGSSVSEIIQGGEGNDILTGGEGGDIFVWRAGDDGTAATPAEDIITDFTTGEGGDVLSLSDLLVDEQNHELDEYLHFNFENGDTILEITPQVNGDVTQTITLEGVDLSSLGSTDQEIINNLLNDGNLQVD